MFVGKRHKNIKQVIKSECVETDSRESMGVNKGRSGQLWRALIADASGAALTPGLQSQLSPTFSPGPSPWQ